MEIGLECFDYEAMYIVDTIVPSKPVPGSHVAVESDSSGQFQFIFNYGIANEGEDLVLYSDATCTTEIGAFSPENGTYVAGVKNAQTQFVQIYGKFADAAENFSECSDQLGSYELNLMVSGVLTYDSFLSKFERTAF